MQMSVKTSKIMLKCTNLGNFFCKIRMNNKAPSESDFPSRSNFRLSKAHPIEYSNISEFHAENFRAKNRVKTGKKQAKTGKIEQKTGKNRQKLEKKKWRKNGGKMGENRQKKTSIEFYPSMDQY